VANLGYNHIINLCVLGDLRLSMKSRVSPFIIIQKRSIAEQRGIKNERFETLDRDRLLRRDVDLSLVFGSFKNLGVIPAPNETIFLVENCLDFRNARIKLSRPSLFTPNDVINLVELAKIAFKLLRHDPTRIVLRANRRFELVKERSETRLENQTLGANGAYPLCQRSMGRCDFRGSKRCVASVDRRNRLRHERP
jgi:hypothetical protein